MRIGLGRFTTAEEIDKRWRCCSMLGSGWWAKTVFENAFEQENKITLPLALVSTQVSHPRPVKLRAPASHFSGRGTGVRGKIATESGDSVPT